MGPSGPIIFAMNKRMQARERKRTEKTRTYNRDFNFKLFVYVNDMYVIETRVVIGLAEIMMPELDPYQLCSFMRPKYTRDQQYLVPDNIPILDFLLKFTRTGQLPTDLQPAKPVSFTNSMANFGKWHLIGSFTFKYLVNEYLEQNKPGSKFPWQARVWEQNTEMTRVGYWHHPVHMKTWLSKSKALVALPVKIAQLEEQQSKLALQILQQA
jgi:hypothetical protein